MPNIKMPNGDVVAFPDDMPPEQIKGMIAQKFPREVAQATLGRPAADREQPSAAASAPPMPGLGKYGTAAAAMPNGVPILGGLLDQGATAASAGLGSIISGEPYAKVKSEMEGMKARGQENHPVANVLGNIAGGMAVLGPVGGTELGATALGMRGGSLAEKALYSSLSGGGLNMADTLARGGSGEDALRSGAIGLGLGAAAPLLGRALGGISNKVADTADSLAGAFNPKTPRITADEFKALGSQAYKDASDAGVIVNGLGTKNLLTKIQDEFKNLSYLPASQPGARNVLRELQRQVNTNNGNITLDGLDAIRSMAGDAWQAGNPKNNLLLSKIRSNIDDLINSKNPNFMAGLNTDAGVEALNKARQFWNQGSKLATVEKFARNGEAIGGSQINQDVPGATRRQVRKLLTNEAAARGFTPEELAQARQAAQMSAGQQAMRAVSGLLPKGQLSGGLQLLAATQTLPHLAYGNPLPFMGQIAGMGAGYLAKKGEDALSRRAFDKFADTVARNGKPAYQNTAQKAIGHYKPLAQEKLQQAAQIPLLLSLLQGSR